MIDIKENVPLCDLTTFKVGGPARYFSVVRNEDEIVEAANFAKSQEMEVFLLGGGSNIVVSDKGFEGLVIKLENNEIIIEGNVLECQAGASLYDAVRSVAENGLSGFEWAAGIPGSFGGAIRGNAGAFGGEISSNIESVRSMNLKTGKMRSFSREECEFSYRTSFFKKNPDWIIVSARMRFQDGSKERILDVMRDIIRKRTEKQPQGFASAGSFFQNPIVENKEIIARFEKDIGSESRGGKVAAGWLIEQVGLSGKKIGGAMISEKHANFLVNAGNAKADDIAMLSSYVKQQVRDKMGIQLVEEIQWVGF